MFGERTQLYIGADGSAQTRNTPESACDRNDEDAIDVPPTTHADRESNDVVTRSTHANTHTHTDAYYGRLAGAGRAGRRPRTLTIYLVQRKNGDTAGACTAEEAGRRRR